MKVAIYARISRDATRGAESTKAENNTVMQIEDCKNVAQAKGYEVVEVFEEVGKSAYDPKIVRWKWRALLKMVEDRTIEGIVCHHVDRLYRRPKDLHELIDLVRQYGLHIESVQGGQIDLNTADGRLMAGIGAEVAQHESAHKSERIRRVKADSARQGLPGGGRVGFGYDWHVDARGQRHRVVNEKEAEAIRRAAHIVLTDDRHSLYKAEQAASEIVGRKIGVKRLRDTLMSARIAGLREHWTVEERDASQREGRSYAARGASLSKGDWEPIVTEGQMWELRRILADRSRYTVQGRPPLSLLSGLVRCGLHWEDGAVCDCPMGSGGGRYKCGGKQYGCDRGAINRDTLDEFIKGYVLAILRENKLTVPMERLAEMDAETEQAVLEKARLEEIREGYEARALTDRSMTMSRLNQLLDAVDEQISVQQAAMDANQLDAIYQTVQHDGVEAWENADTEGQRRIIRAIVKEIIVHPKADGFSWAPKFNPRRIEVVLVGSDRDPAFVRKMVAEGKSRKPPVARSARSARRSA